MGHTSPGLPPSRPAIDVLHVIDTARLGGPGRTILNSARYIDPRFRVHIASFTNLRTSNELIDRSKAADIPALELAETRRFDVSHLRVLRDYCRAHAIRIVHGHGYRSDVIGWLSTRNLDVAFVTTHHGWIRNNWRQALFTRMAVALSARFDGVEVVSTRLADELPAALRQSERVAVIHNALVIETFQPSGQRAAARRALDVEDTDVLFGVVGRLSVEKGCIEMVDAFAALAATDPHVRLIFVGEGPLEAAVRAGITRHGIESRVRLVAHQQDVRPIYEALDVLVCPSRTEGLSNVIMEAMAFARPVVATRVGGNPELVVDGETGLLAEPLSEPSLSSAMARVAGDAELRNELGRNGLARVRAEFSFQARMRKEEAFYDSVLARRILDPKRRGV